MIYHYSKLTYFLKFFLVGILSLTFFIVINNLFVYLRMRSATPKKDKNNGTITIFLNYFFIIDVFIYDK